MNIEKTSYSREGKSSKFDTKPQQVTAISIMSGKTLIVRVVRLGETFQKSF